AVAKLEHQLHKLKTKVLRRDKAGRRNGKADVEGGLLAAAGAVATDDDEEVTPRIVKTKAFTIKPMTPEEAALQMDLLGHDFFFFVNADTERAAVVYQRDDGD